jgi:type II secretory ATPase GspE/PulE/Tfp pilus assembly ATPase PilB-like protein
MHVSANRSLAAQQSSDPEGSAPEIVERLVRQAEQAHASDIHLQMREGSAVVSFRLDSVITPVTEFPGEVAERVFGRIKFLAHLKTYQESLPQDGRIAKADLNSASDIRVATYPTVTGEKIVLRLFQTKPVQDVAGLQLPESTRHELDNFLQQTSGLLLLTGPAGSGKTTTIYACLRQLAQSGGRHIITVEDPVEQVIPGVMQTEVNEARGLDFGRAARHLLRQDPQVLVIGEIRDEESAAIAIRAALTGHLVIATLHAGSCRGVFERLFSLSRDSSAVASSIDLVLNQRLVRCLCPDCSGKGCEKCLRTGYRGRVPIAEHLRITDPLRPRLAERDFAPLSSPATLAQCAESLIRSGITTRQEIDRVLGTVAH